MKTSLATPSISRSKLFVNNLLWSSAGTDHEVMNKLSTSQCCLHSMRARHAVNPTCDVTQNGEIRMYLL